MDEDHAPAQDRFLPRSCICVKRQRPVRSVGRAASVPPTRAASPCATRRHAPMRRVQSPVTAPRTRHGRQLSEIRSFPCKRSSPAGLDWLAERLPAGDDGSACVDSRLVPEPFRVAVPQPVLDELARRLDAARWPEAYVLDGGEDAARLQRIRRLFERWRGDYDWRQHEARINEYEQHMATGLHVLKAGSSGPRL